MASDDSNPPPTEAEPALEVRMGSKPGASLRIKAPELVRTGKTASVIDAYVPHFKECAVSTTGKKTHRCVIITPAEETNEIEWHGFYVRGRFRIADRVWHPGFAARLFKEFQPS